MKKIFSLLLFLLPLQLFAENADSTWVVTNYTKREVYIPMRDGVKLCTIVYEPKSKKERHPILMQRTIYSIAPYGKEFWSVWNTYLLHYFKENYIVVMQDVRGKMMSEGEFEDIRPYNHRKEEGEIDEASDTYDTIEWLLKNTKHNNGRVGIWGISYPGFYATMAALSQHPAVKAVSPQAPVTDWYVGDDFHHNGAFMLMDAFNFISYFGRPRPQPTSEWWKSFEYYSRDNYKFYLETGSLRNFKKLMGDSIAFWKDIYAHPDYDDWWQIRNVRNHVKHIPKNISTLVVGGFYDAEDCFGATALYKAIEKKTKNDNRLVMGPWAHGYWWLNKYEYLGNVRFGSNVSKWYQENIEVPYFNYHLKGKGNISKIKEANIFFSGSNQWRTFDQWPPAASNNKELYLHSTGQLSFNEPETSKSYSRYTSDPQKPVPYMEDVHFKRLKEYMSDDQRFAARRPDVLVFQTDTLQEDVAVAGPVIADLFTAISTTDADFVVKVIDVFPDGFKYVDSVDGNGNGKTYPMGGYQMLVRGEVMRGRYRNSLEKPEAFEPGEVTEVKYTLPDIAHVFKKGHRIMIQVQSSWFPLVDRNPQQFVNIYTATDDDFIKSNIRIYHDKDHASKIILPILE